MRTRIGASAPNIGLIRAFGSGPANGAHGTPYGLTTCPENRMGLGSPGIQPGRVRNAHAEWNFGSGISDRAG